MNMPAAFLIFALAAYCAAEARVFFVDGIRGNDSFNGLSTKTPFRSLARSRDAIRALQPLTGPVTVQIRGGTYDLSRVGLALAGAHDSGAPASPITYEAYRGEHVLLSGGRQVRGLLCLHAWPCLYKPLMVPWPAQPASRFNGAGRAS